jgi:putative CRISPR-associated protein (TIGR02619 family)
MASATQIPKVFVSPCGTSLLTNQISSELRSLLLKTANLKEHELTPEQHNTITQHIQQRKETLLNSSITLEEIKRMSAELNGIITYHGRNFPDSTQQQHYLLVSDTYQGEQVGDLVVAWLESQGVIASKIKITDLATSDPETFRSAMSELIRWCDEILTVYRKQNWRVIFSLTGGFKGVNGFLQALAMFYAHESVYIFQGSSELLRIPQLPITIDHEGIVGKHLTAFRKLNLKLPVTRQEWEAIPEILLIEWDEQVGLSEWGELVWLYAQSPYYQGELLPPLSSRLHYSDRFRKEVSTIERDRVEMINKRLDQLSCYLETNGEYNPPSLDFKKLKGKPFQKATHECDAWSDADAKRLYGHFENHGIFFIDHLSPALH